MIYFIFLRTLFTFSKTNEFLAPCLVGIFSRQLTVGSIQFILSSKTISSAGIYNFIFILSYFSYISLCIKVNQVLTRFYTAFIT